MGSPKIPENRRCLKCNSPYSYIHPQTGWVQWYCWNGGFICSTCKNKIIVQENKMICHQSYMEMADILPVGSHKALGELWP